MRTGVLGQEEYLRAGEILRRAEAEAEACRSALTAPKQEEAA
jgi:hypothetical protein